MPLKGYVELLRLPHLAFSLPFAYVGALFATEDLTLWKFFFITLAVIGLRSASLAYNDIADREIDSKNPRTSGRPLIAGRAGIKGAYLIVISFSMLFFVSSYLLNWYAFILSPFVWLLAMSYPYSKRIHPLPHLHLGVVLGMVVFGGAIGAVGSEAPSLMSALRSVPWLYVIAVCLWVSGFDIIYAISDIEFDKKVGVKSLPAWLGEKGALIASSTFFLVTVICLFLAWRSYSLGLFSLISIILTSILLIYETFMALKGKYLKAFRFNLVVAPVISVGFILDILWEHLIVLKL